MALARVNEQYSSTKNRYQFYEIDATYFVGENNGYIYCKLHDYYLPKRKTRQWH